MAKRDFKLGIANEMEHIQQKTVEMNKEKKLIWLNPNILLDDEDNEFFYGDFKNDIETLSVSIKRDGFNEVIFAYKVGEQYKIRAGHRRKYAAIKAGVSLVPVVLEPAPKTDYERVIGLLDANNNKREDKPMIMARTAAKYYELIQKRRAEDEEYALQVKGIETKYLVADKMGKSASTVAMYASLMKLIPSLQEKADNEEHAWSTLASAASLSHEKQVTLNEILDFEASREKHLTRTELKTLISDIRNGNVTSLIDYDRPTVGRSPVTEEHTEEQKSVSSNATEKAVKKNKKTQTVAENIRSSAIYLSSLLDTAGELNAEETETIRMSLAGLRYSINRVIGEE